MSNYVLVKTIFCLVLITMSMARPSQLAEFYENDIGEPHGPETRKLRGNEIYEALKDLSDAEKRAREVACKLFMPGSNCDYINIPGMAADAKHYASGGPGRR